MKIHIPYSRLLMWGANFCEAKQSCENNTYESWNECVCMLQHVLAWLWSFITATAKVRCSSQLPSITGQLLPIEASHKNHYRCSIVIPWKKLKMKLYPFADYNFIPISML